MSTAKPGGSYVWLAAITLAGGSVAWGAGNLKVVVDTVPAEGNSSVAFSGCDSTQVRAGAAHSDKDTIQTASTSDGLYRLDLSEVSRQPKNRFYIHEFQLRENGGQHRVYEVKCRATIFGQFMDQEKAVQFHVLEGEMRSTGMIVLPLHPADALPDCRDDSGYLEDKPAEVSMVGVTPLTIKVVCQSALEREIRWIRNPEGQHPEYWSALTYESDWYKDGKSVGVVKTKHFTLMKLKLEPHLLSALRSRVSKMWVKGAPNDRIVVEFGSVLRPAGQLSIHRFEIPIVFDPPPYLLAACLGCGVLSGWLVCLLDKRKRSVRWGLPYLARAAVAAVIASFCSLAAYATNSQINFGWKDMNPFDVVMQFLLGVVMSVLMSNKEWVRRYLKNLCEKVLVVVLVVAGVGGLTANGAERRLGLAGLSSCPDGTVVGLAKDGAVYRFSAVHVGQVDPAGRINQGHEMLELTCAALSPGADPVVLVTGRFGTFGSLFVMNPASGSWKVRTTGTNWKAGVAYDASNGWVYLISLQTKTIDRLRLDWSNTKSPDYWADVFGDTYSLGSLALDRERGRLLVGDSYYGNVRAVDLKTKQQRILVEGFGEIASMSIDSAGGVCYVGDHGRRTVWRFSLTEPNPRATVFARGFGVERLSGVAVGRDGTVWVSDSMNGRVYVLDRRGLVIRTIE